MTIVNPFTERGRITDAARFAGRWSELSLIFERLEAGRPVLISGVAGVGKSSLLTHVTQSAAVNLELPDLHAYYLDLQGAERAGEIYSTVAEALGQRARAGGPATDTLAALELALVAADAPVLLCLDNAQGPLAAGWGAQVLEALARVARGTDFFLVVAMEGTPPLLSEPFAMLRLGALAQTEVRLLVETYLDGTEISFTPVELRQIFELSGAHPAYVQRAAFHLFQSKIDPSIDWRSDYLVEAKVQPIPGAPLPPAVFQGRSPEQIAQSGYSEGVESAPDATPQLLPIPEAGPVLFVLVPLLLAALVFLLLRSIWLTLAAALIGFFVVALWRRPQR